MLTAFLVIPNCSLPIAGADGHFQGLDPRRRDTFALPDDRLGLRELEDALIDGDAQDEIGVTRPFVEGGGRGHVDRSLDDLESALDLLGRHPLQGPVDVHEDRDLGSRRAGRLDGRAVEDAAVHEQHPPLAHGFEDDRERHRGPHGPIEPAFREQDLPAADQVDGVAEEFDGQVLDEDVPDVSLDVGLDRVFLFQAHPGEDPVPVVREHDVLEQVPGAFEERAPRRPAGRRIEVHAADHLRHALGGDAGREKPTDDPAHRRAGHDVREEPVLFEDADDADMGEPPCAAAHEDQGPGFSLFMRCGPRIAPPRRSVNAGEGWEITARITPCGDCARPGPARKSVRSET
ncbi:MAG: hypothetical protein MZV64_11060 [Ignavibacteriales bacterium]|nr:hypothetical protein [Ignavibacteriales bacterium]